MSDEKILLGILKSGRTLAADRIAIQGICWYVGMSHVNGIGVAFRTEKILSRLFTGWSGFSGSRVFPISVDGSLNTPSEQFQYVTDNVPWVGAEEYIALRLQLLDYCIAELESLCE